MSDRIVPTDRDDAIARRLVGALDALPVPAGPARLRTGSARRPQDRTLLVFAAVALMVLAALSSEPVRDAAVGGTRWILRALFGPPWTGYYIEAGPSAGGGPRTQHLRFAAGEFPGTPTRPSMERQIIVIGPWSPDGELLTITDMGSKIYVGDRLGNVRQVADLGPGYTEQPRVVWVGPRSLFAMARTPDGKLWAATIDVRTGTVDLRRLETPIVPRDDPPGISYAWASPDGRWLAVTLGAGGCGELTGIYEIATHRIVDVVDPQGRPAYAAGWLSDGRLVSAFCDRSSARVDIFVSAPGVRPDQPIATLPLTANSPQFAFDYVSDRFLVFTESPTRDSVVRIFDSTGRVVRMASVPRLTQSGEFSPLGGWFAGTLSRDGRFLSFRILEQGGAGLGNTGATRFARSGVVNLVTGELTYGCDVGCFLTVLR